MQKLQGTGVKMEDQGLNQERDRKQEFPTGTTLQQVKQEPEEGLQQGWEAQWQDFLRTMQATQSPWKNPLVPQFQSMEDSIQAPCKTVVNASRWLREEGVTQTLPDLSGETHNSQDAGVKVKEEILDEEDTVHLEIRCQHFRQFCYQEAEGPQGVCNKLQELCHQWLKPETHTKEQILELVILEQFLTILPQEMQSCVREHNPENCIQAVALAESFLLKLQETESLKRKIPELSEEVHKSERDPSDTMEVHLFLEAKEEGDGPERAKLESMLERPNHVNAGGTPLNRTEGTFFQDPGEKEMSGNQQGPEQHPDSPWGKPAEKNISCKEHDGDLNENTFQERVQRHKKEKTALNSGKSFTRNFNLFDHKKMEKGEKPFKCSYCGKISNGRTNLMIHERTHTGEKPYECSECGKSFSTSSNLINHKRVHTGEKPYKCSDCGQHFSHNASLIRHRRTHTGEKPYKCSDCGKSFIQKGELIAHKRTHTGEKPYECPECGRSFSTSSHLIRHKRVHIVAKPRNCSGCGKGFHRKSSLGKAQGNIC
ncbi:zinc finger and SCAN domain-containing protein 31-like isoform X2 [Hemicordylus capensis]|uniref:zinc finger and SCAN domain-containing protein 31-like isoform X2 n=1 Tax=Hemicordylus capensis TaxID=884348 RepID=UPI002302B770|nr:zinc finger and SCAN domain-containing protein 31-like isoform X2 [Hemicordylus capensis]